MFFTTHPPCHRVGLHSSRTFFFGIGWLYLELGRLGAVVPCQGILGFDPRACNGISGVPSLLPHASGKLPPARTSHRRRRPAHYPLTCGTLLLVEWFAERHYTIAKSDRGNLLGCHKAPVTSNKFPRDYVAPFGILALGFRP